MIKSVIVALIINQLSDHDALNHMASTSFLFECAVLDLYLLSD